MRVLPHILPPTLPLPRFPSHASLLLLSPFILSPPFPLKSSFSHYASASFDFSSSLYSLEFFNPCYRPRYIILSFRVSLWTFSTHAIGPLFHIITLMPTLGFFSTHAIGPLIHYHPYVYPGASFIHASPVVALFGP